MGPMGEALVMAFDFPNAPTVGQTYSGYVWDGEKWLTQPAKGSKKNYIINGAMMVSQENGTTAGSANGYYPVDTFFLSFSNGGTQTAQQVFAMTPGGSPNRFRITATAADASVAAGDFLRIATSVEGLKWADLMFGYPTAKTITIQFGIKAPAGTYAVSLRNPPAYNRTYVAEYTIAAGEANADVIKSVTLVGNTSGAWVADNTAGVEISFVLMAGSSVQTPAGVWTTGNLLSSSNQFNFMGTNGNVFELFDVSLTEGNVAPPFVVPDYASELAACMRYYRKTFCPTNTNYGSGFAFNTTTAVIHISYPVRMRSTATIAYSALADFSIFIAGGGSAVSSIAMDGTGGLDSASVLLGGAITAGQGLTMKSISNSGWLSFSARL